jgi:hypothetical protein
VPSSRRKALTATQSCYRDHDRILLFPYEKSVEARGTEEPFNVVEHFGLANALARYALLRRCEGTRCSLSGFNRVSFVRNHNLARVPGELQEANRARGSCERLGKRWAVVRKARQDAREARAGGWA